MPETFEEVAARHKDVDPFLLKKWERIFNVFFDRNSSAAVDWGDFYLVVRQVRDIYGAESDQMGYARKSMKALWEGLCKMADTNNDQIVSLDEWITLLKGVDPKNEPKWFNEYLTFMFKLFDVSGDGVMDLAEYTDGMNTYGFSSDYSHEAFKLFAVDKKGNPVKTVDPKQWRELFHQYYFSTDPKALGNQMFGRLDAHH
uniref:EF-hand domain-containing protein n=1 Tax=Plectus sambesii TaxID=2011161 RepID=A0A914WG74_9BILA